MGVTGFITCARRVVLFANFFLAARFFFTIGFAFAENFFLAAFFLLVLAIFFWVGFFLLRVFFLRAGFFLAMRKVYQNVNGQGDLAYAPVSTITTSRIGPCAPCTRIFSMSAVRLDPLMTQAKEFLSSRPSAVALRSAVTTSGTSCFA